MKKKYILLSIVPIADRNLYFLNIRDLFFSKWGYGVPTARVNAFTYQIGWPFIVAYLTIVVTVVYAVYKKIKIKKELNLIIVLLFGILLFSILLFPISKLIWNLPLLSEINYPWTILSQLSFMIAIATGFLTNFKITKYVAVLVAVFAVVLYIPNAKPEKYISRDDSFYFTNDATTTSSRELMPLWVKEFPVQRYNEKVEILKGSGNINILEQKSNKIVFNSTLSENSVIRVNTIYYPGWEFDMNGKQLNVNYSNPKGVMDLEIPKGQYLISGVIHRTQIRLLSELISIAAITFVVIVFCRNYIFKNLKI